MTSFLTGGLGGLNSTNRSPDSKVLDSIDSKKLSYANKDFVKNISWLNQSVDTLSAYTQKLQQGVESANSNALEQIQGFWGDLFVLFAGFEPTGVDIGDVKYVIQGIGAFFGINPETPFPLNLVEAALHFFNTYILPLDQFTDVIFDAILAWAQDFGLPEEFIQALHELFDAIVSLTDEFDELFASLGDILGAFGFLGFTSTSGLGDLWDILMDLISGVAVPLLKPVLQILSQLGLPFIKALTWIVKAGSSFLDPLGAIAGGQVASLGSNIAPIVSGSTLLWNVSGDAANGWVVDENLTASDTSDGSFTTLGNGTAKRLVTQKTYIAQPEQKFTLNAAIRWTGIPSLSNAFGLKIVWFNGATEVSETALNINGGHGSTGNWTNLSKEDVVVPQNVDGFKIAVYVGTGITSGQVWVDDISVQLQGKIGMSLIEGIFDAFLGPNSPLNALNIFGQIPQFLLGLIGIGNIGNVQPNLLTQPGFDASDSISLGAQWIWDGTTGRTTPGCARVSANGTAREMNSSAIPVAAAQELAVSVWAKWAGLAYSGTTTPIRVQIHRYLAGVYVGTSVVAALTSPVTNQATWQQLSANYTIPAGCDSIRLVFLVPPQLSAGTVWWDDAEVKKTGMIQIGWVQGLLGQLGGLGDFIQGVIDSVLSVIRGIPFVGGTLAQLFTDLTGWHTTTVETATVAVAAQESVQTVQDTIVSSVTAQPTTDAEPEAVAMALDSQTQTIISQGAALEQLTSQLNGESNSGATLVDDFEYPAVADLGSTGKWTRFVLSGTDPKLFTDGHDCGIDSDGEVMYRFNTETLANYQRVTATVASQLVYPGIFDGRRPRQSVYCRVSADGTKWVRLRWNNVQRVSVDYRNGATFGVLWESGGNTTPAPGPGSNLTIEPGVGLNQGQYRIWRGNTPLEIVDDTSHVTDWTPKGVGIGFYRDAGFGAGSYTQFTASDNAPSSVVGIGFRAYRNTATGVSMGAGDNPLPANTLNTVDRIGAGMVWTPSTQTLTINVAGWYLFGMSLSGGQVGTRRRIGDLFRVIDGTPVLQMRFGDTGGIYNAGGNNTPDWRNTAEYIGTASAIMYCEAGTQWRPGEYASAGHTIVGDAGGLATWFSCALLNRSTA